ncbi:putative ribonuclease H-like domain-containing protein [Tanacetum coccineum]
MEWKMDKEIWEASKTRFGGNAIERKMPKAVFKQQLKAFTIIQFRRVRKRFDKFTITFSVEVMVPMGIACLLLSTTNIHEKEEFLLVCDEVIYSLFAKQSEDLRLASWKTGTQLRVRVDGKAPVGFDKKKLECFNCHKTGHFARESDEETNLCTQGLSSPVVRGVPHPLSGDYTPKPQEEIDESLYDYGKKEPQEPELISSEHSVDLESEISRVPQEVYVSKPITTNEKGVSAPKSIRKKQKIKGKKEKKRKEVEPSCVTHIKTPRQPIKDQETPKVNRKNWNAMMERELGEGYSFTKKKCFVCGSLSHLIKDCDYYEKKMAREAEFKKQRVFNTGNRVAKPVWTNADRINHANQFVPRPVQLNSVRPNLNTGRTNINSVRPRVNTVNSNVNTVSFRQPVPTRTSNSFSPKRPQVNHFNQRRHFSKSHSSVRRPFAKNTAQMSHSHAVKGNWGSAVKTSASYNWRTTRPNSNCNGGPTFIRTVITKGPQGRPKPVQAWYGWLQGHMTVPGSSTRGFEDSMGGISYIGRKQRLHNSINGRISGIKQEYSNAKTPQQNGVAKRMNETLNEAARTMLADSLLPTTFWAEAVSTACYILNRHRSKALGHYLKPTIPALPQLNSGSEPCYTGRLDPDDSPMPEF